MLSEIRKLSGWVEHTGDDMPEGLGLYDVVECELVSGVSRIGEAHNFTWADSLTSIRIVAYRLCNRQGNPTTVSEVKSDDGGSDYYKLRLPDHVLADIKRQIEDGDDVIIQTGDCIEMLVGNDFDGGNIIKALRRIFEGKKGAGKAGVDPKYDLNKCHYFIDEVEKKL